MKKHSLLRTYKKHLLITSILSLSLAVSAFARPGTSINVNTGQTLTLKNLEQLGNNPATVVKLGDGSLLVLGDVSLDGDTLVAAGTMYVMGSIGNSTNHINIADGSVLAGPMSIQSNVTFSEGSINTNILSPSNGGFTSPSGVTIPVGSTLHFENSTVNVQGNSKILLYFSPTTIDKIFTDNSSTFNNNDPLPLTITPVPGHYATTKTFNLSDISNISNASWASQNPQNLDLDIAISDAFVEILGGNDVTVDGSEQNNKYLTVDTDLKFTAKNLNQEPITLTQVTGQITLNNGAKLTTTNKSTIGTDIHFDLSNGPIIFKVPMTKNMNLDGVLTNTGTNNSIYVTMNSDQYNQEEMDVLNNSTYLDFNSNIFGRLSINNDNPDFTAPITLENGFLQVKGAIPQAPVYISGMSFVFSTGTIKSLEETEDNGGYTFIVPDERKVSTLNILDYYKASAINFYIAAIEPDTTSSRIKIHGTDEGNVNLENSMFIVLPVLKPGHYPAQTTNYNLIETNGSIAGNVTGIVWIQQPEYGLTMEVGPSEDKKHIILKMTLEKDWNNLDEQSILQALMINGLNELKAALDVLIINTGDVNAEGLVNDIELSGPVFSSHGETMAPMEQSLGGEFRFKAMYMALQKSRKGYNGIEQIANVLNANGIQSIDKGQMRLWTSPFVNLSRLENDGSKAGSIGRSGGTLIGIEKRDKDNISTIGFLTGILFSRSHLLSQPYNSSAGTGYIFGAFHKLKYTDYKDKGNFGHELMASHVVTDYDLKRSDTKNPSSSERYYTTASYENRNTTLNAQLNYLFNIKQLEHFSCRLDFGATLKHLSSDPIVETGSDIYNITVKTTDSNQLEYYGGIGLRKSWKNSESEFRLTGVYEYGYQAVSSGGKTTSSAQGGPVPINNFQYTVTPTTSVTPGAKGRNKHYFQLYGSYFNIENKLKLILSYFGTLSHKMSNHTAMLKIEYRF